jgi:hypothetical protein
MTFWELLPTTKTKNFTLSSYICVAKNMPKQISLMQLTVWMANTNINIIVHPVAGHLFCLQHVISHVNTMGMKLFYIQC